MTLKRSVRSPSSTVDQLDVPPSNECAWRWSGVAEFLQRRTFRVS